MTTSLPELGLPLPVWAAPLAGGPTTPALVIAASRAGSLGFLAGGYKTAAQLANQIATVRAEQAIFGVNLFAPNPLPVDPAAYRGYADALRADADRYGVELAADPVEGDDHWAEKVELLLSEPVPVVSFTFGVPDRPTIEAFRRAGSMVVQSVTSAAEAAYAVEAGADALAVQSAAAGGHSGTLTPSEPPPLVPIADLVAEIHAAVRIPLIAAGGIGTAQDVAAARAAGAAAAMVGTALLLSDESGASAPYRAALADSTRTETVVTRAFTGRPARSLRNAFTDRYSAAAPLGYPALHYLTSPLRRAAGAAGDPELINLWAGTGHRYAVAAPAATILSSLAEGA
jgi:NAD(P)H-dependent flavin oxidoreductase YrpB (nitropropane dioxygenase family)